MLDNIKYVIITVSDSGDIEATVTLWGTLTTALVIVVSTYIGSMVALRTKDEQ